MAEIPQKFYGLASLGLGLFALIATFTNAGGYAFISGPIALLFALLSLLIFKYGYWVVPFITRGLRVVEVREGGYEIPPAQDVVLKEVGGVYYASMFLLVKIFESTTEKGDDEQRVYTQYFERAISGIKSVVKFSMMVYVKDLAKYRENIETRRMEAQLRLQREMDKPEPDPLRIDRYEREKSMWDAQLSRLAGGVKPMGSMCYLMTTSSGITKDSATAAVKAQAAELRTLVSNALNVEVVPLVGEEMKQCFEWEYFIPPTARMLDEQVGL
ncbi:hypothetical protein HY992_04555 [Candidatus Micrarchaeota archaeon]|nr:hypothetical protein [Candidatus Micrarchaeota archaeon]